MIATICMNDRVTYKAVGTRLSKAGKPGQVIDKTSAETEHGFIYTKYTVLLDDGSTVECSWRSLRPI